MPEPSTARRTPFYQFVRLLCVALSALVYPCRLLNPEGINREAPFILMCNHQSMMDPLLLAAKFRHHEIRYIGKRELTRFKPLKWIVERLHMIAVSRHESDLGALRAASAVLREGHVLGIFPEGTRMHGKPMEHIESGVSLLALRSRVPLVPVLISGRPLPWRLTRMLIGDPIPYDDILAKGIGKEAGDELNLRIRRTYEELAEKIQNKNIL
jgi:1-acyl-sn-glycerol-3-phosphate acyltransferase